ncbi:MAG: hypothetical protein JNM63_07725, partial [Spirochaetia bacterium]|nr:hypothetical protein [Spirochaetia bacterium]
MSAPSKPSELAGLSLDAKPVLAKVGYSPGRLRPLEEYRLPDLWSLHLYGYAGKLQIKKNEVVFPEGSASLTPPGVFHRIARPDAAPHYYAHFRAATKKSGAPIVLWSPGEKFADLAGDFADLIGFQGSRPLQADVRLWDLLLRLDQSAERPKKIGRPEIRSALLIIEQSLSGPFRVADLAWRLGISQNHLGKLFQAECGSAIGDYVRSRKVERARLLLLETHYSVK